MNLQPYIAYNGGQIDLDPITFVGEKVKGEGDFRVNYKEGGEFTKHYCKDYVPEMENSELMGDPMFYVYDGTIYPTQEEIVNNTYFTTGATEKLADGVIAQKKCEAATNINVVTNETTVNVTWNGDADSYDVTLKKGNEVVTTVNVKGNSQSFDGLDLGTNYSVVIVAKCGDKNADSSSKNFTTAAAVETPADFTFYFKKDDSNTNRLRINDEVRANMVQRLKEDPSIKGFRVEGWASPEGELDHNENLALDRSKNAKADIEKQIKKAGKKVNDFEININGNGPDWQKFKKDLENSDIPEKDLILRTINNASNQEQAIKEMIDVYPVLESDILPLIRRAEVYIIK
jgi:hypothetical protein